MATSDRTRRERLFRLAWAAGVTVIMLALLVWLAFAFLFLGLKEGENTVCRCWADRPHAWQYTAQAILALLGSGSLALSVLLFRRDRRPIPLTGAVGVLCLGLWVALLLSGAPTPVR